MRGRCLIVTGTAVLAAVTGCSSDPLAGAVSEVRGALPAGVSQSVSDNQIVATGRLVCGTGIAADNPAVPPAQQETVRVLAKHCDVWRAADIGGGAPSIFEGDPPADLPASPPSNEAQAGAGVGAELSPRGAWPVTPGRTIDSFGPPGAAEPTQRVTVEAIEPVPTASCQGGPGTGDVPVNGRFVSVRSTVQNLPGYIPSEGGRYLSNASWEFVDDSGQAFPQVDSLAAFYCAGKRAVQLPYELGAGRTYNVVEFMDVPVGGGWLIMKGPDGNSYEYRIDPA